MATLDKSLSINERKQITSKSLLRIKQKREVIFMLDVNEQGQHLIMINY